jgi:hypothetical protein
MDQGKKGISRRNAIIAAICSVVLIVILANIQESKQDKSRKETQPAPDIPSASYEIVDREDSDTPLKTQVTIQAMVSGKITESSLKQLLQDAYDEAEASRGFRYHGGTPSHVAVYLYTSEDHFKSGMGQWIAMLTKLGDGAPVDTQIRTELIAQLDRPPEEKFGLSEATRREIFEAIVRAEDKANAEAEKRYPFDPMLSLSVGETFPLSKETPLITERNPTDPIAALSRMKRLPAGSQISITGVEDDNNHLVYQVRVGSLESGWIDSIALMGQSSVDPTIQMHKQTEMSDQLTEKYTVQIAHQYDLTEEQLDEISTEALKKNWPFPSTE